MTPISLLLLGVAPPYMTPLTHTHTHTRRGPGAAQSDQSVWGWAGRLWASWCHLSVLPAKWPEASGSPDTTPPARGSVCRARSPQPAASGLGDAAGKHVHRSRISNEMSWARVWLWNVCARLPGFQLLLGSVVREVRSPLPGVPLPDFLLPQEPPRAPLPQSPN